MKPSIIFICSANSIRSPMAEALFRHTAEMQGVSCETCSAGALGSGSLHPMVAEVLREEGIALDDFSSRSVASIGSKTFSIAVTLSEEAHRMFRKFPHAGETIHWDAPDPTLDIGDRREAFRALREFLRERIERVVARLRNINP